MRNLKGSLAWQTILTFKFWWRVVECWPLILYEMFTGNGGLRSCKEWTCGKGILQPYRWYILWHSITRIVGTNWVENSKKSGYLVANVSERAGARGRKVWITLQYSCSRTVHSSSEPAAAPGRWDIGFGTAGGYVNKVKLMEISVQLQQDWKEVQRYASKTDHLTIWINIKMTRCTPR